MASGTPALVLAYRAVGAAIAIAGMELLGHAVAEPLYRVPFVTSIVLVMASPKSEPARWSSILGGHLSSCAAGYLAILLIGPGDHAAALAVGLATLAMMALRCLHPPAGINAFLIAGQGLPLGWMLNPVAVGAVALIAYAAVWWQGEVHLFRWLGRTA